MNRANRIVVVLIITDCLTNQQYHSSCLVLTAVSYSQYATIGQTLQFIQRPFVGMVYSVVAGLLASLAIAALLNYANNHVEDLALLLNDDHLLILSGILLLLGVIVATGSTFFSIQRYLKMSLDELY